MKTHFALITFVIATLLFIIFTSKAPYMKVSPVASDCNCGPELKITDEEFGKYHKGSIILFGDNLVKVDSIYKK